MSAYQMHLAGPPFANRLPAWADLTGSGVIKSVQRCRSEPVCCKIERLT
jgi:hypothetical protein